MIKEELRKELDGIQPSDELVEKIRLMMNEEAARNKRNKMRITPAKIGLIAAALAIVAGSAVALNAMKSAPDINSALTESPMAAEDGGAPQADERNAGAPAAFAAAMPETNAVTAAETAAAAEAEIAAAEEAAYEEYEEACEDASEECDEIYPLPAAEEKIYEKSADTDNSVLTEACAEEICTDSEEYAVMEESADMYDSAETTAGTDIVLSVIVDLSEINQIGTDDALEEFYKDSEYTYYFPSIKSEYIECRFSNGEAMKFSEALESGKVSVSDLDAYGIMYWIKDKDGNYTNSLNG